LGTLFINNEQEFLAVYEKYSDSVYRVCFMLLKNTADAQDAVQNVFIKLIKRDENFENENHLKAWLIKVAKNECKNMLRHWFFSKRTDSAELDRVTYWENEESVVGEILKLPDKYKLPMYLYYYEGYSTLEVAEILGIKHSTLRTHLKKGREKLKNILEVNKDE